MANIWVSRLFVILVFFLTAGAEQVEVRNGNATFITDCEEMQMMVTVLVEADFRGKIYVQNHEGSCDFLQSNLDPTMYNRSFPYDLSDCGQTTTTNVANNTREFSVTVVVQYSPDVMTSSDTIHTSKCVFDTETSVLSESGTVNRSDSSLGQSESSAAGDPSTQVDFSIYDPDGSKMDTFQVSVGQKLTLGTTLLSDAIFSEMLVKNCRASNRVDMNDADYVSVNLLDESGCPANASVVETLDMEGPVYKVSEDARLPPRFHTLGINAFLFLRGRTRDSNQLVFFCEVLLCPPDNAGPCDFDLKNCTFKANARKRRSVDEVPRLSTANAQRDILTDEKVRERRSTGQAIKLTSVQGSVQVIAQKDNTDGLIETQPSIESDKCLKNSKTQAILVSMGVLLLALLLVVITLVVILCRRRRRRHGDKAKQADDGLSMGSSKQKLAPDHVINYRG